MTKSTVDKIDTTIECICDEIASEGELREGSERIITALAELIQARAVIDENY